MEKEKIQETLSDLFGRLDADGKMAILSTMTCLLDAGVLRDWINDRFQEISKELLGGGIKPKSNTDSLLIAYLLGVAKNT
jgi:hypothetical protein